MSTLQRIASSDSPEWGFAPFKELLPVKEGQVDLVNSFAHFSDSKTPSGIGDMPMTELAREVLQAQIEANPNSKHILPSPSSRAKKPDTTCLLKVWANTCAERVFLTSPSIT
jgi:hypothetical protein